MASNAEFEWPWQYNFPPFFTLQPNADTQQKQIDAWCSLVLSYCRHNKIFVLDLPSAQSKSLSLFHNQGIKRQLSTEGFKAVFDQLLKLGQCEWIDGKTKNSCLIFWKTPTEWGHLLYNWAVNSGNTNTVCTLFELMESDDVAGEEFVGIEERVLIKALQTLEKQRKAEIIRDEAEDIQGVKFF